MHCLREILQRQFIGAGLAVLLGRERMAGLALPVLDGADQVRRDRRVQGDDVLGDFPLEIDFGAQEVVLRIGVAVRLLLGAALRYLHADVFDQHVDNQRLDASAALEDLLFGCVDRRLHAHLLEEAIYWRHPGAYAEDGGGIAAAEV